MSDFDLCEIIDYQIREQISKELKSLSQEEKDCFYDIEERYQELYARYYQEHIDDEHYRLSHPGYSLTELGQYETIEDYDKRVEDMVDDFYDYDNSVTIDDPNKW